MNEGPIANSILDETAIPRAEVFHEEESYWIDLDQNYDRPLKRAIDVVVSFAVLVLGAPFFGLLALLIKITSRGPVFFVQERLGKDEVPFNFYKFRTMYHNNDDSIHRHYAKNFISGMAGGPKSVPNPNIFKITEDPRVTPIGRFLRKTSLDELPQFINILRGEMSLVGPRPPVWYELEHYQDWHRQRLAVKPGLTGLWQVSGRSTVPFDEMVKLDLYYIENWSFMLDLNIVLKTLPVVCSGYGAY